MQLGSWAGAFVVVALTYLLFVFVSESSNPFSKPKFARHKRRRWLLGRSFAAIFLFAVLVTQLLGLMFDLSNLHRLVLIAGSTALLSILPIASYTDLFKGPATKVDEVATDNVADASEPSAPTVDAPLQSVTTNTTANIPPTKEPANQPMIRTAPTTGSSNPQELAASNIAQAPIANTQPAPSLHIAQRAVPDLAMESAQAQIEEPVITTSAERELEMELATAHIDPELSDLDQSIAEAEFFVEENSDDSEFGFARPDGESDESLEAALKEIAEFPDHSMMSSLEDDQEELMDKLNAQAKEISTLKDEKQKLVDARENLIEEVVKLRHTAKTSDAKVRKMTVHLKQALEVKNKALAIATMEQKKRKLVEIRAVKTIAKLKRISLEAKKAELESNH